MNYYAIGMPFIKCQNCGATNDLSNKITEWSLMPRARKVMFMLLTMFWGLGYGIALTVLIAFIEDYFKGEPLYFIAAGMPLGILLSYVQLLREIRQSKRRMQDAGYRNSLIMSGFMEGEPTWLGPNRPKELP